MWLLAQALTLARQPKLVPSRDTTQTKTLALISDNAINSAADLET